MLRLKSFLKLFFGQCVFSLIFTFRFQNRSYHLILGKILKFFTKSRIFSFQIMTELVSFQIFLTVTLKTNFKMFSRFQNKEKLYYTWEHIDAKNQNVNKYFVMISVVPHWSDRSSSPGKFGKFPRRVFQSTESF